MSNYDVTKNKSTGKWRAKREGASRAGAITDTQKEAEKLAKQFSAGNGGGEVRIHRPSGQIRDSDTVAPGNDPCPPKDKKH